VMSATFLTHLEHQWRSLAWRPWLDAFMHDYKLLRYDVRGCGLSDRDPPDLSFENWVRDFARVIDAAAFDRFAILATCLGGSLEYLQSWAEQMRLATSADSAARLLETGWNVDVQDAARKLKCPVLVVHPERDSVVPIEEGRFLAGLIPDSRFIQLDSQNHMP